jgi:flagellar assembly factor FliW
MSVMTELEVPTVTMATDLVGLPGLRSFVLVRIDEQGYLVRMQSLEDEAVRFVVVPAVAFFPSYAPEVSDETAALLGLETAEDGVLLLLVTVGPSLAGSTANLRAPVIVNIHTLAAAQVVLAEEYSLQAPLLSA